MELSSFYEKSQSLAWDHQSNPYNKNAPSDIGAFLLVTWVGLEPTTVGLKGHCSTS